MAGHPDAPAPARSEPESGAASLPQIIMVLLAAVAALLVFTGVSRPGASWALAAGSLAGAAALVLVARRSMELFVLVVLVLRPALDGLHAPGGTQITDPAQMLGALFVVVTGVWWIGRRLTGHRHPGSVAGMAAAGFLAAAAVATLGSDAPGRSVGELARMVTAVLMFFIVDRLCETTGRPDRFVVAVLAAAVVPVTVALVGPLAGLHRVEIKDRIERIVSTFAQSNPLGHFLTIVLLVLVAYVLLRPGQPRVLAVIAMAPVGLTLALTYTRLAWAAAVAGILVMLWAAGRHRLVPALIAVLVALAAFSPGVGHRIDQLSSPNAGVNGSESGLQWRLGQWADVTRLADSNPVTGIGPDVVARRLLNGQPPHNDFLRAFVEMGVVGLVAFVVLLAALIGVAARANRRAQGARARTVALAFVGVITAFVVSSIAANLLGQVVILWYVFALAGAAAWVARHGVIRSAPDHPVARLAAPTLPAADAWLTAGVGSHAPSDVREVG